MKFLRNQKKEASDKASSRNYVREGSDLSNITASSHSSTASNGSVHFGSYDASVLLKHAAKNPKGGRRAPPKRRNSLDSYQRQNSDVAVKNSIGFGSAPMTLPPQEILTKKQQEKSHRPDLIRKMSSGVSTSSRRSSNFGSQCVL